MKRTFSVLVLIMTAASSALAADLDASSNATQLSLPPVQNQLRTTVTPAPSWVKEWTPQLKAGIISWNDSIRASVPSDKTFKGKQEIFAGIKNAAGWSLTGMIVEYRYQYTDATKDYWAYGDPSITIGHPTLYNDGTWSLNGQVRSYLPTTDRSATSDIRQSAYYSFLNGRVLYGREFMNILIPRYFYESQPKDDHTKLYAEDRTQVGQKFNTWFRAGLGQYSQIEQHYRTPTGYCTEIYPYADFIISPNLFFGPRVSFPIMAHNTVYDAPTGVSMSNVYAELFLVATL